jgi:hypothetical protein
VEFLYTNEEGAFETKNPRHDSLRIAMTALTPEQDVEARALAEAISRASADDLLHLAQLLVSKPSDQVFGQTEFQLRDVLHKIGTKALNLYLAEKKTATKAPA